MGNRISLQLVNNSLVPQAAPIECHCCRCLVQALEAIKIVSGKGDVLSKRLMTFDALAGAVSVTANLPGHDALCHILCLLRCLKPSLLCLAMLPWTQHTLSAAPLPQHTLSVPASPTYPQCPPLPLP